MISSLLLLHQHRATAAARLRHKAGFVHNLTLYLKSLLSINTETTYKCMKINDDGNFICVCGMFA